MFDRAHVIPPPDLISDSLLYGHTLILSPSCCGCCCDMRRAVIICNVYMITSAVLWFCLEVLMYAFAKTVEPNDPRIDPKDVQNLPTGAWIGFLTALTAFQCTLYGFGVQGAFTFKKSLVVGALFSYKLNVVYHLMMGNTIGICLSFFLAYPNVVFFLEVDHHIMSTWDGSCFGWSFVRLRSSFSSRLP